MHLLLGEEKPFLVLVDGDVQKLIQFDPISVQQQLLVDDSG